MQETWRDKRGFKTCEGVTETIEHFIKECNNYEQYRDDLIFMVEDIIGRNKWQISVMNGRVLGAGCLMEEDEDN